MCVCVCDRACAWVGREPEGEWEKNTWMGVCLIGGCHGVRVNCEPVRHGKAHLAIGCDATALIRGSCAEILARDGLHMVALVHHGAGAKGLKDNPAADGDHGE